MNDARTYLTELTRLIEGLRDEEIEDLIEALDDAYRNDRQVLIFGNGGSAATASHLACDLQKGIGGEAPKRFKAMAVTDSVSIMTAWANDTEYSRVFSEQIATWVNPGDLVIAISASGNSPNVIRAVELANEKGALTYGLAGFKGGRLAQVARKSIVVPSDNMQQIEDLHVVLAHLVFTCVKKKICC
jgi:D-sedoheptulose 7-phosphate isomerase